MNQCPKRQSHPVVLEGGRKFSPRCLLDAGHTGRCNYSSPKKDETLLKRFLANRSERGMM